MFIVQNTTEYTVCQLCQDILHYVSIMFLEQFRQPIRQLICDITDRKLDKLLRNNQGIFSPKYEINHYLFRTFVDSLQCAVTSFLGCRRITVSSKLTESPLIAKPLDCYKQQPASEYTKLPTQYSWYQESLQGTSFNHLVVSGRQCFTAR